MSSLMTRIGCGLNDFFNKSKLCYLIPDNLYLKVKFRYRLGYDLNLSNPETFNEKLQWLKLYDRREIYPIMADKAAAKEYVAEVIGKQHIIKTLGIWNSVDEIDLNSLPDKFVLKCSHDSGSIVICKDKSSFDVKKAFEKLKRGQNQDFYKYGREWHYKKVTPRILAEEYMQDSTIKDLKDYKFFCFSGKVRLFKIDLERFTNHKANYYDVSCNLLPLFEADFPNNPSAEVVLPENISEMINLAEKLACDLPFIRVDFYNIHGKIYFGELTLFPASGFGKFSPDGWDSKLGQMMSLPEKKEKNERQIFNNKASNNV